MRLLRAKQPFPAGSCRAPPSPFAICCKVAPRSWRVPAAHLGVEILDQPVPCRNAVHHCTPEILVFAAIEVLHRDALLLDPGVVTEIEDAFAVDVAKLHHVIVGDAFQMVTESLPGIDLVESAGITPCEIGLTFALVESRAVGGDRHDDVVWAIFKMLGELDGGDDVRQPGNTDIVELAYQFRIDLPPPAEVSAAALAAEQQVERIAGGMRHADNDIGIHDVVDERDMLVADPLDVVLAMAVVEHGRTFDRFDRGNLAAVQRLEAITGAERSCRPAGTDKGSEPVVPVLFPEMAEDPVERAPG